MISVRQTDEFLVRGLDPLHHVSWVIDRYNLKVLSERWSLYFGFWPNLSLHELSARDNRFPEILLEHRYPSETCTYHRLSNANGPQETPEDIGCSEVRDVRVSKVDTWCDQSTSAPKNNRVCSTQFNHVLTKFFVPLNIKQRKQALPVSSCF